MIRYIIIPHILLVVLVLAGCATREPAHRQEVTSLQDPAGEIRGETSFTERVVQYTATLSIDTEKSDSLFQSVLDLTSSYNGYMLRRENNRITVRIPSMDFVSFLNTVSTYGNVRSKEVEGLDVTEEFYDLTTRLDNAQKTRQRYLELLNRAQTIEDALAVERELERLNREIDLLSGRLNRLKHLSDFSTVTVIAASPVRPGPVGYVFYGLYHAVKWLFVWN